MTPVVFASDHNFIMPTAVAMLSMLQSAEKPDFDIFILQGDDVTDNDRQCLCKMVERFHSRISFISPGKEFSNAYEVRGISTACYFRLLIPWLIPQYDKIIYLDGDIIVKKDIGNLIDMAIDDGMLIYGVRTPGFTTDADVVNYIQTLGLDNTKYINSGVQILNARLMRADNLRERFIEFSNKKLLYQDQDIVNLVCRDRIGWLPLTFNSSPSLNLINPLALIEAGVATLDQYNEAVKNPAIIHYAGKKPWKTFTYHWYDWWAIYSVSPFYNASFACESTERIMHPAYTAKQLAKMLVKKILYRE